jgi:hypothetical protein
MKKRLFRIVGIRSITAVVEAFWASVAEGDAKMAG